MPPIRDTMSRPDRRAPFRGRIPGVASWMGLAAALMSIPCAQGQPVPALRPRTFQLTAADSNYWAFQPVAQVVPPDRGPQVGESGPEHPVDALLRLAREEKKLVANPPATPRELVRRASFDLLGLPPSPGDVSRFESDPGEAAWVRLVDQLLDSPHYGERWGRHWLDLVRFAESNGYERDGAKPDAWRYRDYVIAAFNGDKPYDRFILEQLAGDEVAEDLLPASGRPPAAWRESIIATGFYRLHVWDDEPDSTVVAEFDDLDDILVTTSTAFLGLTVGCARCHDHKFDPISQADYYSMLGFLRSLDPYGQHKTGGGGRGTGKIGRHLATPGELRDWEAGRERRIAEAADRVARASDPDTKKRLEGELQGVRDSRPPFDFALCAMENGPAPKPTHILARGDAFSPREEVQPAFLQVLGQPRPQLKERPAGAATTGRRRVLAEWIASPSNPLTARVMVNRIWQHHFGVGLVPTPDDFGRTGARPKHPALLDFLAGRFVAGGWSIKSIHRLIMTSRAYRMSSRADRPDAVAIDEGNTLLWRQNLRRVEAEVLRDTMLAAGGSLNPRAGGPSVFPTLPAEVHTTQDSSGKGWADSSPDEQNRRSVYLVVKRALKVPLLECLDFANSASASGTRPVTTTAPQALMLLNDGFVQVQAAALAGRIAREAGGVPEDQVRRGYELVLQRIPAAAEMEAALSLWRDQRLQAVRERNADPERAARISFCRALLNLNETAYAD